MKCFAIVLLVAVGCFSLALANPIDVESVEPISSSKGADGLESPEASAESTNAVRDKRTLLFGATPYAAAPLAYSAYTAPLAYSAAYSAPYASYPLAYSAYSAYSAYPYYASSYYVV
ncbi:uncharacterized protein LOC105689126 [Athalia rosae]|uniref:uncharacterized protein LOC105689126 n=1 Tax=Athalia rosae TaxID=37344 RepID=UPI002034733E|nr:uncharacterized protein LOC105689126 [Athalia rosae]